MSAKPEILLVEDDDAIALVVKTALARERIVIDRASTIAARDLRLAEQQYRVLITDVVLPDGNGLDGLGALQSRHAIGSVIVLSAQNTLNTAVRAANEGAFEYLPKPFDLNELLGVVRSARARGESSRETIVPADEATALIGRAPAMQGVYRTIARLAGNDLSVLILGESGTGKELVARAIHDSGRRRADPFVAVNMAAIPRDLIESELFGHERGAFTGAHSRKSGRFEQASGGTLFLDEIGDMPLDAQTRLLRVLQSGEFIPVGASAPIPADVRIIAATHQDLAALVASGRFREDLYYRLNVVPLELPPLRDRRDDIPELVAHFIRESAVLGLPEKHFDKAAMAALQAHPWPGNVRELRNMVQRLLVLSRDDIIGGEDVTAIDGAAPAPHANGGGDIDRAVRAWLAGQPADRQGALYRHFLASVEAPLLAELMSVHAGNQVKVAAALGINRNTLRVKLRQLERQAGEAD